MGAVVDAAIQIADARGADSLSMRALASALGIEAMSLYTHVKSKEALLGLMAARLVESIPFPSRKIEPRKRLHDYALALRAVARAHPNVFPLVVLMPLEMQAQARPTEVALQAFHDAGHSDTRAILSQRVFLSFLRGYLLWEIGGFAVGRWRTGGSALDPVAAAQFQSMDPLRFPECTRLAGTFAKISPDQAFEEGLAATLATLFPRAATRPRGKT